MDIEQAILLFPMHQLLQDTYFPEAASEYGRITTSPPPLRLCSFRHAAGTNVNVHVCPFEHHIFEKSWTYNQQATSVNFNTTLVCANMHTCGVPLISAHRAQLLLSQSVLQSVTLSAQDCELTMVHYKTSRPCVIGSVFSRLLAGKLHSSSRTTGTYRA